MKTIPHSTHLIPHGPGHPRNSEGSFATLGDGRILFAYSCFVGESGDDDAHGFIAGLISGDGGRTWDPLPEPLVEREGRMNVMSPSFLRLQDGRLALFYARKNHHADCRLYLRTSKDDGGSWSDPVLCTTGVGYHVVNNDRVIQLASGTLLVPATFHRSFVTSTDPDPERAWGIDARGLNTFFRSEDGGATWGSGGDWWAVPSGTGQETGVIERLDGSLWSWCRTDLGCQWCARSVDEGRTWSSPEPTPFLSPRSPMSVKRIPSTGDWIAVWNDHHPRWDDTVTREPGCPRTPLVFALSADDGETWGTPRLLEAEPNRGYSYCGIHCTGEAVLLSYGCGLMGRTLADTNIRRLPLDWIYPAVG